MDAELDKEQAELRVLLSLFLQNGGKCKKHASRTKYPRSASVAGHDSRAGRISDTLVADCCAVCGQGYHREPLPGEDLRELGEDDNQAAQRQKG